MQAAKQASKIKCPKCGYEYLPSEIYLPNTFFGKNYRIDRDENGKIVNFSGEKMNLNESFECWNCHTAFKVHTVVMFQCSIDKEKNFNEDYETKL